MVDVLKIFVRTGGLWLLLGLLATAQAQQLYRWVDENGVVHYGDSVPPRYAKTDRQVLNDYGVPIETLPGERTAEELAADQAAADRIEAQRREEATTRQQDAVLLSTYLSVSEIEALRDRRVELIDGQIRVTEIYLENLRGKREKLEKEAQRFRPYSPKPDSPPIPDNLARELSDTLDSIILYEQNLDEARQQARMLTAKFDADIDRFKALKGLD